MTNLAPIDPDWPYSTSDEFLETEPEPEQDFQRWMQDAAFAGAYEAARSALMDDRTHECDCRTCECWEPAEDDSDLCLGCQHNAHPGEVE